MDQDVTWTYLSVPEITMQLGGAGYFLHDQTVQRILGDLGFSRRQAVKKITLGNSADREAQFDILNGYKQMYLDSPNPIFSIDTKKKETIGNFFRAGRVWGSAAQATLDHDFSSAGDGRVVPHGIYDLKRNSGHVTLGLSSDTSQFACDSFALYWQRHGQQHYPQATSMLWLCDCGGSNNARHHIFKEDLQKLVNQLGISIRVAHYPPYCSKYNPIEHRMFCHITRACQGVIFRTVDIVKQMIKRTWTNSGLSVTVGVINKAYETGRAASDRFFSAYPIRFDDNLPSYNYTAVPTSY